jgi:UDP:flavonoid glycosyltransferase YjiC (YdhE family)
MRQAASAGRPKSRPTSRRIVLTTFGSLGDLYPYLAVARELQARGHESVIASTRHHQQRIEARGVGFAGVRPDGPDQDTDSHAMQRIMDPRSGTEYVVRELLMPALRESYEDTLAAAHGADLLVSHVLTYTTRLVAEKKGIPWASALLQPLGFFSAYDPPVLPQVPSLARLRFLGPALHRPLFWLAKRSCQPWVEEWHSLRAALGLPQTTDNPLFDGIFSPSLVLAMFSTRLAHGQPDWPAQTVLTGFPFTNESDQAAMPPELDRFLDDGPPPIVFTLGSSAALGAGQFYQQSAKAASLLGMRAVFIVGKDRSNIPASLPDGVVAFEYAPFADLFPRASAIVHPGGVGTTALAMRSGRPMLVVPFAHDQFDNAARVARLGIGRTIPRRNYIPTTVAAELRRLLKEPRFAIQAFEIGDQVRQENGVKIACDALESLV